MATVAPPRIVVNGRNNGGAKQTLHVKFGRQRKEVSEEDLRKAWCYKTLEWSEDKAVGDLLSRDIWHLCRYLNSQEFDKVRYTLGIEHRNAPLSAPAYLARRVQQMRLALCWSMGTTKTRSPIFREGMMGIVGKGC